MPSNAWTFDSAVCPTPPEIWSGYISSTRCNSIQVVRDCQTWHGSHTWQHATRRVYWNATRTAISGNQWFSASITLLRWFAWLVRLYSNRFPRLSGRRAYVVVRSLCTIYMCSFRNYWSTKETNKKVPGDTHRSVNCQRRRCRFFVGVGLTTATAVCCVWSRWTGIYLTNETSVRFLWKIHFARNSSE